MMEVVVIMMEVVVIMMEGGGECAGGLADVRRGGSKCELGGAPET